MYCYCHCHSYCCLVSSWPCRQKAQKEIRNRLKFFKAGVRTAALQTVVPCMCMHPHRGSHRSYPKNREPEGPIAAL